MNRIHRVTAISLITSFLLSIELFSFQSASAAGISIDAGLTPAENRWIFRSQVRYMQRDNEQSDSPGSMKAYMFPVVVAYGLRSDLAIMVRQAFIRREMTMMGQSSINSGLGDLLLLSKYRLIRINTPSYTLGIAPTLALEFPTGKDELSSNSYDLQFGSFFSGRMRSLGMDLNVTYIWNGMAETGDAVVDPGDEFSVQAALAYQISLGDQANMALAPVLEASYLNISSDSENEAEVANTGESILWLSPGFKFTWSSFIFESLIQIPVWQDQEGLLIEREPTFLLGIRLMN